MSIQSSVLCLLSISKDNEMNVNNASFVCLIELHLYRKFNVNAFTCIVF
jgi:hypothetical protein